MARAPTKKAAMHFDGDPDNSDEGDCKAGNEGGSVEEEEGDDCEDADDCDAAAESGRFRAMKGDNRFHLFKNVSLGKALQDILELLE